MKNFFQKFSIGGGRLERFYSLLIKEFKKFLGVYEKVFSNIIICMLSKQTSNIIIYENINIQMGVLE